ncbi:hypothetical protein ACWDE0_21960 [Streptomyces sp. 900105755]
MIRDPDALRTVWLFGRPYFWDRPDGRLTLRRALPPVEQPVTNLADAVMTMLAGPLRPKEERSA